MSKYIDGFVIPIPKQNIEKYLAIATHASQIWKEYGALEYVEAVGDDLEIEGQVPFPQLAGAGPDETVIFAYIVYESREHRDAVNAKVMADPRVGAMCSGENAPFDFKRMAYGGFKAMVEA